tara:strand:- start:250 stop:423 length:174 start_codon:yes stop_codon:yes gene_type:complete
MSIAIIVISNNGCFGSECWCEGTDSLCYGVAIRSFSLTRLATVPNNHDVGTVCTSLH